MHAEYKRDVSHNYLILHGEETVNTASYQVRMLTGNTMSSILKCRMQGLNGKWLFYYDITSKQSLASFYEQRKLGGEDLEMILTGFIRVMEEMGEFLLNAEQLVLCPEYMFLDVEKREVFFCCLPDYHHPVQEQFRELTEYFLPKLDHEDAVAVSLGYGVYRKAMEAGLQLEHIKALIYRAGNEKNGGSMNKTADIGERDSLDDCAERIGNSSMENDFRKNSVSPDEKRSQYPETEENRVKHKEKGIKEKSDKEKSHDKKSDMKWKLTAGCAAGVMILLGILMASYLGYLPEISVEAVLGAAILLMGVGAGCGWLADKKKKKQEETAEWRNKVQRELASESKEKSKTERNDTGRNEISRNTKEQNSIKQDLQEYETGRRNMTAQNLMDEEKSFVTRQVNVNMSERKDQEQHELYGETVVLSAGQLSGSASLVSREPGELPTIYLEEELTVVGKLEQASDVVLPLPTVSRVHARIRKTGDEYYLADLNSRNGTSVNGRMLAADEEYLLQDEDQVDFAQARYVFLK